MKKYFKTIIICLIILLTIWIILFTIDLFRARKSLTPLITFKESVDNYEDGIVKEYYSLGYVVRFYERDLIKENEIILSFFPQKFKYISSGKINDIGNLITGKELVKNSFIEIHGKYNPDGDNDMQSYTYSATVNEQLETTTELVFDEKYLFNCLDFTNEKLTLEKEEDYIIIGRIKKIKKSKETTNITLNSCYMTK